jgi:rSAM/selenodomain-associated transferase 1
MTQAHRSRPALVVIAKAPVAGLVKTRLCPPLDEQQAALVAQAALSDTLAAVIATRAARHVLVLDGEPGDWLPDGVELVRQREGTLATRLADAFLDVGGPALLIGMDTPQVTPALLALGLDLLAARDSDSVLGLTPDGGYWAIGLRRADRRVFSGVPMSSSRTGAMQSQRMHELGLRPRALPRLRDVDRYEDAVAVAAIVPAGGFARIVRATSQDLLEAAV